MTGRSVADLLAERRSLVIEKESTRDKTAKALLLHGIHEIDAELGRRNAFTSRTEPA